MELHEYVAETLKQIINGVSNAQEFAQTVGAQINPPEMTLGKYGEPVKSKSATHNENYKHGQMVDFDVALTVSEDGNVKGGIGVFVGPIGVGTQAQTGTANTAVNKIKFSIPLFLPEQKKAKPPKD